MVGMPSLAYTSRPRVQLCSIPVERVTLVIGMLSRPARNFAFALNLMESGVDFVAKDAS
jgi:hypothetical protein